MQTLVAAIAPLECRGANTIGVRTAIGHKATLTQMAVLVIPTIVRVGGLMGC